MDPVKPSLELLRSLTDEHVLRALMRRRRLTRAELAAETGISKPTVGESVRRLVNAGLVADTGQRTTGGRGRGRVGSYYALADRSASPWRSASRRKGSSPSALTLTGIRSRGRQEKISQASPARAGCRGAADRRAEGSP